MKGLSIELIIIAIGITLLFVGDKIANVGASVDSIISSKWTAAALIIIGGGVLAHKQLMKA